MPFCVNDRIRIRACPEIQGTVDAIVINQDNELYQMVYYHDGQNHTISFAACEIEKAEQ